MGYECSLSTSGFVLFLAASNEAYLSRRLSSYVELILLAAHARLIEPDFTAWYLVFGEGKEGKEMYEQSPI